MSVSDRIAKEYALRRATAQRQADAYLSQARSIEEFRLIDNKLRSLGFDIEHARVRGEDLSKQEKQEATLREQWSAVALAHKIIADKFEPQYSCPLCKDTGTVNGARCDCYKQVFRSAVDAEYSFSERAPYTFDDINLEIFKDTTHKAHAEQLYSHFRKYAEKYPNVRYKNVLLIGGVGVGKTFAISCLANAICDKCYAVNFVTAFELNKIMLQYHTAPLATRAELFAPLLEPSVLVIDDLGTEPILRNVTREYLYLLLSERAASGSTFITTNLSPEQILERYGERVFSRVTDKQRTYVKGIMGKDLRIS